jgi:glycosyltransferase involved in cell wall biosynthesis
MAAQKPKVAIVHDWLIGGGAEKVVEALHQMYPDAPIYTSYCTDEWRQQLNNKVVTGYLQHWPFSKLRKFIPILRILWFSRLKFDCYDIVISSSGAEAKGIKTPGRVRHISYIHAPTHYYWNRYDQYLAEPGFGIFDPLARLGLKVLVGPLRKWDYKAAQRADIIIANSSYTQAQIKKYYGRDSSVVFPPVDVSYFSPHKKQARSGFVISGRHTPYKRFDLAVQACTKLKLPLTVFGTGPDTNRLKAMAGPTIQFMGHAGRGQLRDALQKSTAFIFPGIDDFGIAPVEALAAGCPVIAYKDGGALDYITPGKTGDFFDKPTAKSLATALEKFEFSKYNSNNIVSFAKAFNQDTFKQSLAKLIK